MNPAAIAMLLAFLVMGVADAMGPMSDAVKKEFQISATVATLLPFTVFIAFAIFSVPGGILAGRIGKKNLLLLGLAINTVAMAVPSVMSPPFGLLLGCIFLLGIGTTFLQVAGNPIMRDVSPAGAYSRNLALAQGMKGIGSASSSYLAAGTGAIAFLATMGWRAAFPVYCLLMIVALVLVASQRVEETQSDEPPSVAGSLSLLGQPIFLIAVLGIFLYVGAEACMGRFATSALEKLGIAPQTAAVWGAPAFFLTLTVGRLLASALLTIISPLTCLRLSALLGVIGAAMLLSGMPALGIPGVIVAGLGFANIWPMLFSITVEHRPEKANELSGLMCMAISGGAIVPLLMANLYDREWGATSFIVPLVCFAYLLLISLAQPRKVAA